MLLALLWAVPVSYLAAVTASSDVGGAAVHTALACEHHVAGQHAADGSAMIGMHCDGGCGHGVCVQCPAVPNTVLALVAPYRACVVIPYLLSNSCFYPDETFRPPRGLRG